MAIEVLSLLLEAHPDARLTMIGPDKHDGSLQETMNAVQRLGVGEQVQIVGFVPKCDLPDWFDAADVFLNTARVDNAPVTVIEAMVSGMCVVSTDVGGVSSLVQHRSNGLLVPSGKAFEMMQAVHELVGDADLAARCSGAAMHARKQRDWESLVLDWESLLLSVYRGSERSMGL
jgi:glycosyltransferase involved in cell wall biosynthesis